MLIAIVSEGFDPDSLVAEKFGGTPYIIFYDMEKNTFESLCNPYSSIFGGAGIQTAKLIIEKNVVAVITNEIGEHLLRLMVSAGVEVYSCSKMPVKEVVNQFIEGKLSIIRQDLSQQVGREGRGRKRRNRNKYF
jgi:predicted Fe-Mo cluster-binding NifX family protein